MRRDYPGPARSETPVSLPDLATNMRAVAAVQYADVGIAMLSGADHTFTIVNPCYERMIGVRALSGRPLADALPSRLGQQLKQLLGMVYATQVPLRAMEQPFTDMILDLSFQPIRGPSGMIAGVLLIASDVTRLVQARDEMDRRWRDAIGADAAGAVDRETSREPGGEKSLGLGGDSGGEASGGTAVFR